MQIGELAAKTGVSRDAIRLYEKLGLIASYRRNNGYRDFSENTPRLVEMIKLAQSLGFTLAEVAPEMQAIAAQGLGAPQVETLLTAKLKDVDARLDQLKSKRDELAKMISQVCPVAQV